MSLHIIMGKKAHVESPNKERNVVSNSKTKIYTRKVLWIYDAN